jgi:two-component system KDP operon response regulator KdpE
MKIIVVEDEVQVRKLLKISLESSGHEILVATNGNEAVQMAANQRPEAVILDLGLPDMDGTEVLKKIRGWSQIPIIILSVRNSEDTIIHALDSGADDYLTKPFHVGELMARIRVACRHAARGKEEPIFKSGNLEVDLSGHLVKISGEEVKLTSTEFNLLTVLIRHAGKILTHRQILKEIWGPNATEQNQYLRVYISHLRQKIEMDPDEPKMIITEPGIGYRFRFQGVEDSS